METSYTPSNISKFIETKWDESIFETISEYIKIPNLSPEFDPECLTNGHMDKAVKLISDWILAQKVKGLTLEKIVEPNRTPVLFMEIKATSESANDNTVLMYGHCDKQPPLGTWSEGLAPTKPVVRNGRLYGRGGADDGYSSFAAITCIKALQEANIPHGRIVILIEASEESGSPDLEHYISSLKSKIGKVTLICCLDSGAGNYEQLWLTSSLRGIAAATVTCKIMPHGIHSGQGSGVYPDSFRVLRNQIEKIEDSKTGTILLPEFHCEIPKARIQQAHETGKILGFKAICGEFHAVGDLKPTSEQLGEILLNRTWRPQMTVIGADGMPAIQNAGNVLRPFTSLKLSCRLPPRVDCKKAINALTKALTTDVLNQATITVKSEAAPGWDAPPLQDWLLKTLQVASQEYYKKPALFLGEGGSIPFMGMLGKMFPSAQFVVTGVLGPGSNAHAPDEFLDIQFTKNLMGCLTRIVMDWSVIDAKC